MYPVREAADVDRLVAEHAPMVKRIAYHLIHRLPPNVQLDDLVQTGIVGLIEAAKHYNAGQGASFETYAGIRVRGAMLDEVRRNDWAPRSVHRKAREISSALRTVENRLGRAARATEVASEMGVSLEEYHRLLREATGYQVFSFEEAFGDGEDEDGHDGARTGDARMSGPFDQLSGERFRQALARTIGSLPEREALVLSLYYDEELNLREIGEVLGVSESRVSQIHSQALMRLRARMVDWRT
ncbi:RNA polymerase sigma factor FliA [Acidihalobacter prosperus]|uniref:RNA polymerase sigma factor FliA n=1 Tax=Acidihalobacter prosperus TaxID=160660 RepID=A0A1A6C5H9_9GAMM|nr:RNA polymerase sigma factor FliA [Acidihalobacter prosperus]OBS09804.1 RNA polymerase sigma factor for flagellar operon [Acidihalobacter prosperus]